MKKELIFIAITFVFECLSAQVSPHNDETWVIQNDISDEFNGEVLDNSKWKKPIYSWGGSNYYYCFKMENVRLNDGKLLLIADKANGSSLFSYYSGGIQSINNNYTYGYYEIKAKLPAYERNGKQCGKGFWPCFWTFYQKKVGGCYTDHDEIDILEPCGSQFEDASTNVVGWHDIDPLDCTKIKKLDEYEFKSSNPLSLDYHIFAAEWLPDRIIFYFDDEPIYFCDASQDHQDLMKMKPQYVVIDLQLDGRDSHNMFYPEASDGFPYYMKVDYFRYYKLNMNCGQRIEVNCHESFMDVLGVYDFISVSNVVMNYGEKKVLRANDIVISNDFNVPLGAELYIIPTPCIENY